MSLDNFQVLIPMYKGYNGIDNVNDILAEIFNGDNNKYKFGENIIVLMIKLFNLLMM